MAKRHGTHALLRDNEHLVHELIQRKLGAADTHVARDFQRSATSRTVPSGVVFYSDEFAVLFRDGELWNVIRHNINPADLAGEGKGRALVQNLGWGDAADERAEPLEGSVGALGEGAL